MTYAPDDYALVIGIDAYPKWNQGAKSLKGAVKDAQDFHRWLVAAQGGGLLPANAKLVVSTEEPLGPLQHTIDEAFGAISDQSEGKTRRRFYFFFSGHGHSPAGRGQQQSLCLTNWSPVYANAALHLESYVRASVGCLKFSESIFFLDCCRVRAIAPLGRASELECGDPDTRERHSAILYGSDQYGPTFEDEVDDEVRGFFTAGLLKVLARGTIEFSDLFKALRPIVQDLAHPRKQTVRAIPTDKEIYFGPPGGGPPPANNAPTGAATSVTVFATSRLMGINSPEDVGRPPPVGDISISRDDRLVAQGTGSLKVSIAPGRYQVRIDHGEASATHEIQVDDQPLAFEFALPRRSSAALLSNTIGKREWLTMPAVGVSRWDASEGEQAAFISIRPRPSDGDPTPWPPEGQTGIAGRLSISQRYGRDEYPLFETNTLHHLYPGMSELRYYSRDGKSTLPFPIAKGWDTHIFLTADNGRLQLGKASVSMRPAGAGFDPADALIDAYERAIADLVTGGPGPDPELLDDLLAGKHRNPLFRLLAAHFLIRRLRREQRPVTSDLGRLAQVTEDLGMVLGTDAPDVVALRIWKALIAGQRPTDRLPYEPPLFSAGFRAFIEATALQGEETRFYHTDLALELDDGSPWTVPRHKDVSDVPYVPGSASWGINSGSTYELSSSSLARLAIVERDWRAQGFSVETTQDGGSRKIRAARAGDHDDFESYDRARDVLSVPDAVVGYMRDAIASSQRTGRPLDFVRLVRRAMLPLSTLLAAKAVAEQELEPAAIGEADGSEDASGALVDYREGSTLGDDLLLEGEERSTQQKKDGGRTSTAEA